jgi:hypothetical protein
VPGRAGLGGWASPLPQPRRKTGSEWPPSARRTSHHAGAPRQAGSGCVGRGSGAPQQSAAVAAGGSSNSLGGGPEDNACSPSEATAGAPGRGNPGERGGGGGWLRRRLLIARRAGTRVA